MAIDWSLGVARGDPASGFQQGYQNALAMREHQTDRALQQQQLEAQQQQQKQTQGFQLTERHRQDIRLGARIVRQINPTDDATWQRARMAAQQAGVDITEVPEHFDANYVQQLLAAGQQLDSMEPGYTLGAGDVRFDAAGHQIAAGGPAPGTPFMRDAEAAGIRPGTPEFSAAFREHYQPPIVASNGDGTFTVVPRAQVQGGQPPTRRTATNPQTGEQIEYNEQTGQWQPVTREAPAFQPATGGAAPGQRNFP